METRKFIIYSLNTSLLIFLGFAMITAIVRNKTHKKSDSELTKYELVELFKSYAEKKQIKEIVFAERESNETEIKWVASQTTRNAAMLIESTIKNTYFVPVDGQWSFLVKNKTLCVVAPALEAKKQNIDPKMLKGRFIGAVSVMDGVDNMELFKKEFIDKVEKKAVSEKILLNVFDSSRNSLALFFKEWIKKDLSEKGVELDSVLIKFQQEAKFPPFPFLLFIDNGKEANNN